MADWWSDRLSGKAVQPRAAPREGSTPTLRFTPIAPPTAVEGPPTPQEQYMATQMVTDPDINRNGQVTMGEAIRMWKGGEAHRKEGTNTCPECGSHNVFSRTARHTGNSINGAHPAPRCYECGWNGLYDQGVEANWVS
jgi:predicted nucleic-acid-binding Zn-ribbon protein